MASRIIRGQMKNCAHLRRKRGREAIVRGYIKDRQTVHRLDENVWRQTDKYGYRLGRLYFTISSIRPADL